MDPRHIILDRDGVLNVDRHDYVKSVSECSLIAGCARALARLHEAGVGVVVATNQACIGKGIVERATVEAIHASISAQVEAAGGHIAHYYICPHRPERGCECRKPAPGLLLQAAREHQIALSQTWFVGDSVRDVEAGERAGCRVALVLTGKGRASRLERPDVPAFADIAAFVDAYLQAEDVGLG